MPRIRNLQASKRVYSYQRPLPRRVVEYSKEETLMMAQSEINRLDWKYSVRAASTTNVDLSFLVTEMDGVTLSNGDRVLLKDQDDPAENGIYVRILGMLERAEDAVGENLSANAAAIVEEGDRYRDTLWVLTTNDPIEVGVTALTWELHGDFNNSTRIGVPPAEACDGTRTSFTLPGGERYKRIEGSLSVAVYLNGVRLQEGVDFDATAGMDGRYNGIEMSYPPGSGHTLLMDYVRSP